ncbi:MAG: dihydropteroate synthase [Sediminibacterium sp.]|nr:dihydropteroate synthase [Sediminibacterium sp.]MBP6144008.1 dihydropteroate synthase [Sediminibacterium sp.]
MFKIHLKDTVLDLVTPQVMGILNATPDSFYKESRIEQLALSVQKAVEMVAAGAAILDIGGQSTRPGAELVSEAVEIERVVPVIEAIHAALPQIPISIDTYHAVVAKAALDAGASIVNDISCGNFDKNMIDMVVANQAGYIGMHQTGDPATLHQIDIRSDIMQDLLDYFNLKKTEFASKGLTNWIIDPGFGFSKTIEENFTIVKSLNQLQSIGLPMLLGVSRKSSIYKTLGVTAADALNGTTVLNTVGLLGGANILRVHDVQEAKEAIVLINQLLK